MRFGGVIATLVLILHACGGEEIPVPGSSDGGAPGAAWRPGPALPRPVSNNAVAALQVDRAWEVYSFLGLDTTRVWSGVRSWAFRWRMTDSVWTEIAPVPGPGRLAATAQAVRGRIFVFGGYTVAEDGSESSRPEVDILNPGTGVWTRGAPFPVPVDDAVSGVWRDSLVYVVSGWHDRANVPDVQVYDAVEDRWFAADSIPGPPVFGHAGAASGDVLVYMDGAAVVQGNPRFQLAPGSWRGTIDPRRPERVGWEPLPAHPGPALYRAAAVGVEEGVIVYGGTDNPYNYDGIGYDGVPAEARAGGFMISLPEGRWRALPPLPAPSMDHRNLVRAGDVLILIGGMDRTRAVTDRTWIARIGDLLGR